MGRLSKMARGSVFTQRETTSARIEGLLKDPIGVLDNTHKPIIGWLCCYTPQGIILAAGLTPLSHHLRANLGHGRFLVLQKWYH